MKDIILDRLNKMEDLQQRRLLRNLMSDVFLNLVEYQEELNRQLELRVFQEVGNYDGKYDVHVSLCSRQEWDPLHEYLFPMIPEDTEPAGINFREVVEGLNEDKEIKLGSLYLECGYPMIQQLLLSDRRFQGDLVRTQGRYALRLSWSAV